LLELVYSVHATWLLGHPVQLRIGSVVFAPPPPVEAGSNTSTVTLRVVGGDEKGSLESETVKHGHEPHVTRTLK
jgi:hypothetical protein